MSSTSLTITVNRYDDTEFEFEAACGVGFDQIARAIEMGLEVNGVKPGDWSSLVVVVGAPSGQERKPSRPKLSVVN